MTDADGPKESGLSPEDAFGILGNEIRMNVLYELGQAPDPLSFSTLREAVGIEDPGQFNYHLEQLRGHFIRQTDEGYALRRPGRRMVEAVLSGAVTEAPRVDRTELEWACFYCGSTPIEIEYREEQVGVYCRSCPGSFAGADADADALPAERRRLFYNHLPPAGVTDRTPEELVITSVHWSAMEVMHLSVGICPRCSAPVERSATICEDHDATDGLCDRCQRRFGGLQHVTCQNCIFEATTPIGTAFVAHPKLLDLLRTHDINPISPRDRRAHEMLMDYDETVHSTDPLEIELTFTLEGDERTFRVTDDFEPLEDKNPYRQGLG